MKKNVLTKIASSVMMLVLFVALVIGLSVVASADGDAEAQWSADATGEPIGSGTLQQAFDAAAAENSAVGYIKVLRDIELGTATATASGGTFTLDLNGKTVTSTPTRYTLVFEGDTAVTVTDTSAEQTGKVIAEGLASTMDASGASLTVAGGAFESAWEHIAWKSGTVDLTAHPHLPDITVCNYTGAAVALPIDTLKIPEGYGVFDYRDERTDTLVESSDIYTVALIQNDVTLTVGANGEATLSPAETKLAPNTTVTLTVTPDDGYTVDEIVVTGATYNAQEQTFTMGEQDVSVSVTFKLYEADWGIDAEHLTEKGSLWQALDAAAADDTVKYIKLVCDIEAGYDVTGGTFTLDLGGKTLTSTGVALYLYEGASVTLTDTVGGGALIAVYNQAVHMCMGGQLSVAQGDFQISGADHEICAEDSIVDLSLYANVAGIRLYAFSTELAVGTNVVLPQGYTVYDEENEPVTTLESDRFYTVDMIRYDVAWDSDVGVDEVYFTPAGTVAAGTTVSIEIDLYEHYEISSVVINGGAVQVVDEENGTYSFVMPAHDVNVVINTKHNAFVWGESATEMTVVGDFADLVSAINASDVTLYAKLLDDALIDLSQGNLTVSGKAVIDMNFYDLEGYNEQGHCMILAQGAELTFFADQDRDDMFLFERDEEFSVRVCFELQAGSSLAFDGALVYTEIVYNGGVLDISKAHLASDLALYNATSAEVTVADIVTLGDRFRAIDRKVLYESGEKGTISELTKLASKKVALLAAVFTVSFDFGEGSGTLAPMKTLFDGYVLFPEVEDVSHPEGLVLLGWRYESETYEYFSTSYFNAYELKDMTLKAEWGAPVYVGGVGLFDGDYLATGAAETSKKRPIVGGYAYYENGVLTLKDYAFEGDGFVVESYERRADMYEESALIYALGDLVIVLVGESEIRNDYESYSYGICSDDTVTIRGEGSLWLDANSDTFVVSDFIMESGSVFAIAGDDAFIVDSLTVSGGSLVTLSYYGLYQSQSVHITGGELYLLPCEDGSDSVRLETETFTMDGGHLVIRGSYGIMANYVTVNGGVMEIESESVAIENNFEFDFTDAFITFNGGQVTLYSYECGILFEGDVTFSGGEVQIEAYGYSIDIYEGTLTVSGGEVTLSGSSNGLYLSGATFTVAGGMLDVYGGAEMNGTSAIIISGGTVYIGGDIDAYDEATVTFGGKDTVLYVYGTLPTDEVLTVKAEEIREIFRDGENAYYEGVDVSHTFSEGYYYDETHHRHVCLDESCPLKYFGIPEEYLEGAAYGEHTPAEGGTACTACGYDPESTFEGQIPEDTILMVGDHYLKAGDYLTVGGEIVTEKPEGGYLYVSVDTASFMPVGTIVLYNFTFAYEGAAALVLSPDMPWIMQLEGESTLTVKGSANVNENAMVDGAGIAFIGTGATIVGDGKLTIDANVGIFSMDGTLYITESAEVIIRSSGDGIVNYGGSVTVSFATLFISSETEDGIEAEDATLAFEERSTVTIEAGDDGIALNYSELYLDNATLAVTADDEGLNLAEVDFLAYDSAITVTADDDAIDADDCRLEWWNATVSLTAGDRALTAFAEYGGRIYMKDVVLDVVAGDDGFNITAYADITIDNCTLNITAFDKGIDLYDTQTYFWECQISIDAKANGFYGSYAELYSTKLHVQATEAAFYLEYAILGVYSGSEVNLISKDYGISGADESTVHVSDSAFTVEAMRYGVYGYLYFGVYGAEPDISVRANVAFYCEEIYLDSEYVYMMNEEYGEYTFYDEDGDYASYVTVRGSELVLAEMDAAVETLDRLLSTGGTFEEIAGSIAEVNTMLATLTNLEGEGRLDLVEKAIEVINEALVTLEQKLSQEIADAAQNAQEALEELQGKLEETQSDLEETQGKLEETQSDLEETQGALAQTQSALEQAKADAQRNLESAKAELDEADQKAKTSRTVAIVIGSVALGCNVSLVGLAIFLERKRKLFSTLFSLAKK